MNFSVNKAGVITRATSGQEIVGSLVKEELELLDESIGGSIPFIKKE